MTGLINAIGGLNATCNCQECKKAKQNSQALAFKANENADTVELNNTKQPPEISRARLAFGILTDDQIAAINESGKLPKNAKFMQNGFGGFTICNNFFGLRAGTQELPVGFEVKKNILGFACVLPKGTEGLAVK